MKTTGNLNIKVIFCVKLFLEYFPVLLKDIFVVLIVVQLGGEGREDGIV